MYLLKYFTILKAVSNQQSELFLALIISQRYFVNGWYTVIVCYILLFTVKMYHDIILIVTSNPYTFIINVL